MKLRQNFRNSDTSVDLAFVGGRLFFYSANLTAGHVLALNPNTFVEEDINLAQIRNSNPSVMEIVKNNKIANTNAKLRITTDGSNLIVICETTNPGEKTGTVTRYWADFFNVVSSTSSSDVIMTFARRIELRGPELDFPKNSHNGITCKGCHRMNFTLKRYKCKGISNIVFFFHILTISHLTPLSIVCSNYDLCQTCYRSGNFGVFAGCNTHSNDGHAMQEIECPKAKTTTPATANQPSCISNDAFNRATFYVTDTQISILLPPSCVPNSTAKYFCRLFDVENGLFLQDVSTEAVPLSTANVISSTLGFTAFFDKKNNLLWNYASSTQMLSAWRVNNAKPSPAPTDQADDSFFPTQYVRFVSQSSALSVLDCILLVLGHIDSLAIRSLVAPQQDSFNSLLTPIVVQNFGTELTSDLFNTLCTLITWALGHAQMLTVTSVILASSIRIIKSAMLFIQRQIHLPNVKSFILENKSVIDLVYQLLLNVALPRLISMTNSKMPSTLETVEEILCDFFDVFFYDSVDLQANNLLAMLQLDSKKSTRRFKQKLLTETIPSIFKIEHLWNSQRSIPDFRLIELCQHESLNDLQQSTAVLEDSSSSDQSTISPWNFALLSIQNVLFSNSPTSVARKLVSTWIDSMFSFSLKSIDTILELSQKNSISKTNEEQFHSKLSHCFLNTVLQTLLISILPPFPRDSSPSTPFSSTTWLQNSCCSSIEDLTQLATRVRSLLSKIDQMNAKVFPTISNVSETRTLDTPLIVQECFAKWAESSHPYQPNVNNDVSISIPGAMWLMLYIDPRCCTENSSDFLQLSVRPSSSSPTAPVYNNRQLDQLSISKRYSGTNGWPRRPLIVAGSTVQLKFHSEAQSDTKEKRWGFRMLVKGLISQRPLATPWNMDLEKTCATLFSHICGSLIVGPDQSIDEHEIFGKDSSTPSSSSGTPISSLLTAGGLATTSLTSTSSNSNSSQQTQSQSDSANASIQTTTTNSSYPEQWKSFLDDIISNNGNGSKFHLFMRSQVEKRMLKLANDQIENTIVEPFSRKSIAMLLKHTHLIEQALSFAAALAFDTQSISPPSTLLEIYSLVYGNAVRTWLRMQVQQVKAHDENMELNVAYRTVCDRISTIANYFLQLLPITIGNVGSPSNVSSVPSASEWFSLLRSPQIPNVAKLELVLHERTNRAKQRIFGITLMSEAISQSTISFSSAKHDLFVVLPDSFKSTNSCHYFDGCYGANPSLLMDLKMAFEKFATNLQTTALENSDDDVTTKAMVLNTLSLKYQSSDSIFLSRLNPFGISRRLISGEIRNWKQRERPNLPTHLLLENNISAKQKNVFSENSMIRIGGGFSTSFKLPSNFQITLADFSIHFWLFVNSPSENSTPPTPPPNPFDPTSDFVSERLLFKLGSMQAFLEPNRSINFHFLPTPPVSLASSSDKIEIQQQPQSPPPPPEPSIPPPPPAPPLSSTLWDALPKTGGATVANPPFVPFKSSTMVPGQWTNVCIRYLNKQIQVFVDGILDRYVEIKSPELFFTWLSNEITFGRTVNSSGGTSPSISTNNTVATTHTNTTDQSLIMYLESSMITVGFAIDDKALRNFIANSEPIAPDAESRYETDHSQLGKVATVFSDLMFSLIACWPVHSITEEALQYGEELTTTLLKDFSQSVKRQEMEQFERSVKRLKLSDLDKILFVSRGNMNEKSNPNANDVLLKTLVLLYRLRHCLPVSNTLRQVESLRSLFSVLARSNTRVQFLLIRLLRHILPQVEPTALVSLSPSVVRDFLDQIGTFFIPSPNSIGDSKQQQQQQSQIVSVTPQKGSSASKNQNDDKMDISPVSTPTSTTATTPNYYSIDYSTTHVVLVHQYQGWTVEEFARFLEKPMSDNGLTGREATSLLQTCMSISQQAQEAGKAVIYTGDGFVASRVALSLSRAGFLVSRLEMSGSASPSNSKMSNLNPKQWTSGTVVFSTAAELVHLVRTLANSGSTWQQLVLDSLETVTTKGIKETNEKKKKKK